MNTSRVILALDNPADHDLLMLWCDAVECDGSYKMADGEIVTERSYIVSYEEYLMLAGSGVWIANQESVLVIPSEGEAYRQPSYLLYPDGSELIVGTLKEVSLDEAYASECYTKVLETGRYFVAA